jgi:diacylglycerol kinase (ATP)
MPRATLIHNAIAGDGCPTGGELRELLRNHGFAPRYATTADDLDTLLQDPGDLVVVAGGDGTVGEVASRLLRRGIPLAILPVGTANNLAISMGITGAVDRLVAGWKDAETRPLSVGRVHGPWGRRPVVESFGLGLFAHAMPVLSALKKGPAGVPVREAALRQDRSALARLIGEFAPRTVDLRLDGQHLPDEYLMVEAMNAPMLGPRLCLAPAANPGDGQFEVVLVRAPDRDRVQRWLEQDAEPELLLDVRSARTVEFTWDGEPLHIDGETWANDAAAFRTVRTVAMDGPVLIRADLAPETVPVLVPRRA